MTATPDTGGAALPLGLSVCETDPATDHCKVWPPTPSVTLAIEAGGTPTFGVFGSATADVPLDPAVTRVHVRFRQAGVLRGSTSVAVAADVTTGGCGPLSPVFGSLTLTGADPEWGGSFVAGSVTTTAESDFTLRQWNPASCPAYAYALFADTGALSSVALVGPTTFYTVSCFVPGACNDIAHSAVLKTLTFTNASFPGFKGAVGIPVAIVNGTLSYP